jgi:predicted transcriptional regulator of viral defense system
VAAKSLLHLGNRAAVDQALSRLTERGQLIRAGRGVYLRPITSRFGTRAPSVQQAVEALANQRGEVIVPSGAAAVGLSNLRPQPNDESRQTGCRTSSCSALATRPGS